MDVSKTGRFIAQLRKERGWTQTELANQLRVTDKAISRWETGKGFPDTSLLQPLADILGVSVGELLAGARMEEEGLKEQTDRIILDTLNYSRRRLVGVINVILFIVGAALLVSPLFLAASGMYWVAGLVVLFAAVLLAFERKHALLQKISCRSCFVLALVFQAVSLILEAMPFSAALVMAVGPTKRVRELYSHFSLMLCGYAHFSPLLTAVLTIASLLFGIYAFFHFEKSEKCRRNLFYCGIVTLLLSLAPLLLGRGYMTEAGWIISAALIASLCLQAVANRKDQY